jgi:hypothetical protein
MTADTTPNFESSEAADIAYVPTWAGFLEVFEDVRSETAQPR